MTRHEQYEAYKFSAPARPRVGYFIECETCHRQFYLPPSRIRHLAKNGHKPRFCSMACYDKTGDKNPFWGKTHTQETIVKMVGHPGHIAWGKVRGEAIKLRHLDIIGLAKRPKLIEEMGKCQRCGFADIRILCIHHKDRNRKNNHRDNLEVLCPNCHSIEHFEQKDGTYAMTGRSKRMTHCLRGHEYSEDNIEWSMRHGRPMRTCKTCRRAARARQRERERAKRRESA